MISGHLPSSDSIVFCFPEENDRIWSPIKDTKIEKNFFGWENQL